jgi:protein-serine/threonine kinase
MSQPFVSRAHFIEWCYSWNSHLVHASDADQLEALLSRWGPDGIGKLGGMYTCLSYQLGTVRLTPMADPRWANPIKTRVRQENQARAVNEVVNRLNSSPTTPYGGGTLGKLYVVNGISSATSSSMTTGAKENVSLSPLNYDGLPPRWGSTLRGAPALQTHPEVHEGGEREGLPVVEQPLPPPPPRSIIPSLTTLEKAIAARIYFENVYFPLFRHVPSRDQRRDAMEREMAAMGLDDAKKDMLRARWRQNETEYLRVKRQKLDANAFIKLKTIGHGEKDLPPLKYDINLSTTI